MRSRFSSEWFQLRYACIPNMRVIPLQACVEPTPMSSVASTKLDPTNVRFLFNTSFLKRTEKKSVTPNANLPVWTNHLLHWSMIRLTRELTFPRGEQYMVDPDSRWRGIRDLEMGRSWLLNRPLFDSEIGVDLNLGSPEPVGKPELRCYRDGDDAILKALPVPDLQKVAQEIVKPLHCAGA